MLCCVENDCFKLTKIIIYINYNRSITASSIILYCLSELHKYKLNLTEFKISYYLLIQFRTIEKSWLLVHNLTLNINMLFSNILTELFNLALRYKNLCSKLCITCFVLSCTLACKLQLNNRYELIALLRCILRAVTLFPYNALYSLLLPCFPTTLYLPCR